MHKDQQCCGTQFYKLFQFLIKMVAPYNDTETTVINFIRRNRKYPLLDK